LGRKSGRKVWIKDHLHERYYLKAKDENYRARSAYKLLQILHKYPILVIDGRFVQSVLDLGCAPGSWIEVIIRQHTNYLEEMQDKTLPPRILGVDLTSIRPFPEYPTFNFIRKDIFKPELELEVAKWVEGKKIDVILSDLAPKTSGNESDLGMQESMVVRVLEIAQKYLQLHGNVVIKVFQTENTQKIISPWKSHFESLKLFKPGASQPHSREMYLIGMNFI
jgi:23S rRNA (uridine2552-2'-O)-methyltransferase